jgi:hypothetical protein
MAIVTGSVKLAGGSVAASPSTAQYIVNYYEAILCRVPSAAETAYWVGLVDNGTMTLQDVRTAMIDSQEATYCVNPIIQLYQAAFDRLPDAPGFTYWVDMLHAAWINGPAAYNLMLSSIATKFTQSAEFTTDWSVLTTGNFVTELYLRVLHRQASPADVNYWQTSGLTHAQLLLSFSQSGEFVNDAAAGEAIFLNNVAVGATTIPQPAYPVGALQVTGVPPTLLTTGADNIVLAGVNQTVNALVDGQAGSTDSTLTKFDTITGDGSTTLVVTTKGGPTTVNPPGFYGPPTIGNVKTIEIINSSNFAVNTATLDASHITGLTAVEISGAVTVNNLNATQAAAITVTGPTTPTFSVTADTQTLGLIVNDGATQTGSLNLTNPTAPGVTTVTLAVADSFDTAVVKSLTGLPVMKTLTISGIGNASVTSGLFGLNQGSVFFDASSLQGTLTLDLTEATGAPATIRGAVGANTITLDPAAGNTVDLSVNTTGGSTVNLEGASAQQTINLGIHSAQDTITLGDTTAVYDADSGIVTLNNFGTHATAGSGSDKLQFLGGTPVPVDGATNGSVTTADGITAKANGSGILTFTGAEPQTTALSQLILDAEHYLSTASNLADAFAWKGSTYLVETPSFGGSQVSDHVFDLVGVTGVTAISRTAALNTILVA